MRSGAMDHPITIQKRVTTTDAAGERVVTWQTFIDCYASKRDAGGRDFFAAHRENAEMTSVFKIRWMTGVTHDMRILDRDGVVYEIVGKPKELGRRRGLEIVATALAA